MIDDIKVGKELGHGMIGTTYLATDKKGNKYALKIEHILQKDIKYSLKSPIWRELEFANNMGKKYPDQFMVIYDHKIISACNHKQVYSYDPKIFNKEDKKMFSDLAKSKYCIKRLYPYKGISLQKLVSKLTNQQFYSMIIQLIYIIYLMQKHGYVHGDFHSGNVAALKTTKKTINILGYKVPTYGYIYSVIDYGFIRHKKYTLDKKEKIVFKDPYYNELVYLTDYFVHSKFWDYIQKNKIKLNPYKKDLELFNKSDVKKILEKLTPNPNLQFFLCSVLFPEIYQKIVLRDKYPGKEIDNILLITLEELLYFVININNPKLLIEFFLNKL
jgi:hypothetical protein